MRETHNFSIPYHALYQLSYDEDWIVFNRQRELSDHPPPFKTLLWHNATVVQVPWKFLGSTLFVLF